jgi:peroxiredoxin Q/BCP
MLNWQRRLERAVGSKGNSMALPETGSDAYGFTLPNQDGESISLADYAGKNVLIWFFPRAYGGG